MNEHLIDGRHVRSIKYLGEWLADLVDNHDSIVIGLFPTDNPSAGIGYESSEGDKLQQQMETIASGREIWYMMLHQFYHKRPESIAAEVTQKLLADLQLSTVKCEMSLLRLLPAKQDKDSIEFLSPPLPLQNEEGAIHVESFDMLAAFYTLYLDMREED